MPRPAPVGSPAAARIRRLQVKAERRGSSGFGHGFVVGWDDRDGVAYLTVHTLGGERLWLSAELMAGLAGVPLLREDWTACELADPLAHDAIGRPHFRDPTTILRALRTREYLGDNRWLDEDEIVMPGRTRCRAFLCPARPPGWPP